MAMGIRVAGDEENERDEAGDGIGDEGGVQWREWWRWRQEQWQWGWQAIDMMAKVTRLVGDEEGKGEGGKGRKTISTCLT
jgi:hypothetical protein